MLTVSNKGRLWTNLGMENSKGAKIFIWWLSSRNVLFSCCGKQQPTNWANLPWFVMGKAQVWIVEQGSPLPSNKVNLALDVNCSCGLCLPLLAWPDPRLASVLEEDQHLPAPSVLWSAMDIHKYVCRCCRSLETCCSSSTLLVLVPPHRWIPHVSAVSQQSLPKLQELWGRGVVGHTSMSLCTPMVLSILEVIWVMDSSMLWRQLQLPLQKGFLSANELFMSKVPSPSCSSRLLHSGEGIIPCISDWTPRVGFSSKFRSSFLVLDGDISACWWWKLLGEAMEMWPLEPRGGWAWSPNMKCVGNLDTWHTSRHLHLSVLMGSWIPYLIL